MINSDELLFCVDENNNPIDPKPRSLVHTTGIWHRTSHIWVINNVGKILCHRRSLLKDNAPGQWSCFFGGHISYKQTYLESAVSELFEEINLKINKKELEEIFIYKLESGKEFNGVFILRWNGNISDLKPESDEIDKIEWFSPNEIAGQYNRNKLNWYLPEYESKIFELV